MDILQMSLSAAVFIAAVILLRALTMYKLPKKTFLVLWGVVLCRLLVPFSIPSPLSFYTGLEKLRLASAAPAPLTEPVVTTGINSVTTGTLAAGGFDIESLAGSGMSGLSVSPLLLIWLTGICASAIFFAVTYVKCRREFKTALPVENNFIAHWQQAHPLRRHVQIKQSDQINAPLTYGVLYPVILLPKTTDWADKTKLDYILTHEFIHIKRFDVLTKLLTTAALCVHWFNPFVWVMYALVNRDIELSCDETVVRTFGATTKSSYALALIGLEEKKSRLTPLCNSFSKNAIEDRITAIMKIKKHSLPILIVAVLLVAGVTVAFVTSKATDGNKTQDNAEMLASAAPSPDHTALNASQEGTASSTEDSSSGVTADSANVPTATPPVNAGESTPAPVSGAAEASPQALPDKAIMTSSGWAWPVEGSTYITKTFGMRYQPVLGEYRFTDHVDIAGDEGAAVYTALAGIVSKAGYDEEQGNYIVISHDNGIETTYRHLSEQRVSAEDTVDAGNVIGAVGSTGNSTDPHLAFCVRVNGDPTNPLKYYKELFPTDS